MLDRKLLLISGKGGVGKSAVTASLALRASRLGKTVLAIGMVDALGLAAHLGVEHLGQEPHEAHPGVFTFAVDRARALDDYLKLQLRVPRSIPTRQFSRALNVLVDTAPGIREIISMGKPIYEVWSGSYDLVLVDAPPAGQLLSYLGAPASIAALVPDGPIRRQAEEMRLVLADATTSGLVLVTTPEELPIIETLATLDALEEESVIDVVAVVANRILPHLVLEQDPMLLAAGPHRDAALLHQGLFRQQTEWIAELPDHKMLPFLFGVLTPGEVAARLADAWEPP